MRLLDADGLASSSRNAYLDTTQRTNALNLFRALKAGESPRACLRRELAEELSATFSVGEEFDTISWAYPDRTVILHFFRCRLESGTIEPRESQTMAWVAPERLGEFDFPPADREVVTRLASRG